MKLKIYEINPKYVAYLSMYASHLFKDISKKQKRKRKYIGIVLEVNGFLYFAPLSSFKEKHRKMQESMDFIKIKDYAVINLNNMFPVPVGEYTYVDISKESDTHYRALLLAEYRIIKVRQKDIVKKAEFVYRHKLAGNKSALAKRCNNFSELEIACKNYK